MTLSSRRRTRRGFSRSKPRSLPPGVDASPAKSSSTRNFETSFCRSSASSERSSHALAASLAPPADSLSRPAIPSMLRLICSVALDCSVTAAAICVIISPTCSDAWMICFSASPAFEVELTPSSTCRVPSSIATTAIAVSSCTVRIISAISFVARAERSANFRTSSATTANSRPCSAAWAASMAAFKANKFV